MQIEQCYIQRTSLIGLQTLQARQQYQIEDLRVKIGYSELDQATSDGHCCRARVFGCPVFAYWQTRGDPTCEVLDGALPRHSPRLLVFEQPAYRVKLAAS